MADHSRCSWLIVGISGVTCGGKTSLALRLRESLGADNVCLMHQDHYFYPDDSPHHVRCASLDHNNYDILSALDMARLHNDVTRHLAASKGPGNGPGGRRVMILEGFSLLNYKPLADMCDLKYYIVLDLETCQSRRALRLYDPPDIPGYFETCVWPEHLNYKKEIARDPAVRTLSGTDPDNLQHCLDDIAAWVTDHGPPQHSGKAVNPCAAGNDNGNDSFGNDTDQQRGKKKSGKKEKERKPSGCDETTCVLDKKCAKDVYP